MVMVKNKDEVKDVVKGNEMNDKIRNLAEQCWDQRLDGRHFDQEMFAELIVRECLVDFYRRYLDITSREDITVQVERYVKEHFGLE